MKRYWVSWWEKSPDYRPLNFPPGPLVLAWWCSGERSDGASSIFALVSAPNKFEAADAIAKDWPEKKRKPREWRFFYEQSADFLPGDRFPFEPWMTERIRASREMDREGK